jgi:serine/threonine protein kinase/tetratricopeptide (TPR) repeat protein
MTIETGTKLGHYEIRAKIGAGGMGEVYLAQDTKLDRKVALKILPADVAAHPDRMKRFVQEAKAASALNHPNIITIYEIDEWDSSPTVKERVYFIATEFIDGETLREREQKPLKLSELLDIAAQVASALAAAHAAGIVHRDIKPENVMLRRDGIVKVLDFGLAKLTERLPPESVDMEAPTRAAINTEPGVVMGTAIYMSPEQARGLQVDARTDIFSLGVVLYEMVAARLPFDGSTSSEVVASMLGEKEPQPLARYSRDAPAELERIVSKALRKDREQRYQTARDLLIDLHSLKDRLQFEAELERSAPTEMRASKAAMNGDVRPAFTQAGKTSTDKFPPATKRYATPALALLLLVTLTAIAYFYFRSSDKSIGGRPEISSIAILPFVNVNANADTEYLSDGIADSLINSLSQTSKLRVIARSSVFSYKGKEVDPQTIARELNVEGIVTGRITQRGDNLSISVELTDARDKSHVWGEQYNRPVSDLLAVQEEISREISNQLRLNLTGEEQKRLGKRYTENTEAYQLYLKGRYFADQYSEDGFKKAVDQFHLAIQKDSKYALAYAGLAETYWVASAQFLQPREAMPKAREAALEALKIDDTLAEAHTSLAAVQAFYDYDIVSSEREFKRALELNPGSASAHQWYAWYLFVLKRPEEALREIRRAQELDPLSVLINGEVGMAYYFARQYDRAIEEDKKAVEMDPNNSFARIGLTRSYIQIRKYEEAIATASKPEPDDSYLLASLGEAYARSGKTAEAQKVIDKLNELTKQRYVPPYAVAWIYVGLGQKQQALDWLEKSYANREDTMIWLNSDPSLDDLRSEPRFQDLVRRVGLPL